MSKDVSELDNTDGNSLVAKFQGMGKAHRRRIGAKEQLPILMALHWSMMEWFEMSQFGRNKRPEGRYQSYRSLMSGKQLNPPRLKNGS